MYKLSTLTIALNEGKWIYNMLSWLWKNLRPFQMVIVDGGSQDNTIAEIDRFGAELNKEKDHQLVLHHNPMPERFDEQRNKALDFCTGNWVLHIDADETYSKSIKILWDMVKEGKIEPGTYGFRFPTAHLIMNENTMAVTGSDQHCRLWRNTGEVRFVGKCHEQPCIDGKPLMLRVEGYSILPIDWVALRHYSMLKDNADLLAKGERWDKWNKESHEQNVPLTGKDHFVKAVKRYSREGEHLDVPEKWK